MIILKRVAIYTAAALIIGFYLTAWAVGGFGFFCWLLCG